MRSVEQDSAEGFDPHESLRDCEVVLQEIDLVG